MEHRQNNAVLRHDFVDLLMQLKSKGQLAEEDGSIKADATGKCCAMRIFTVILDDTVSVVWPMALLPFPSRS